jgi:hypothetical protein
MKILVLFQKGTVSDAVQYIAAATAALTGNYPGYHVNVEATDGASEIVVSDDGVEVEDVSNFLAMLNY